MNIVGILVKALPAHSQFIEHELIKLGCEVHLVSGQGQMVVTLEHESDQIITDTVLTIQNIKHVLSATMVYHQIDNSDSLIEENRE